VQLLDRCILRFQLLFVSEAIGGGVRRTEAPNDQRGKIQSSLLRGLEDVHGCGDHEENSKNYGCDKRRVISEKN